MQEKIQAQFQQALSRLEKKYEELKKNNLTFKELQKIQFLQEILKEQTRNENVDHTAR